MAETSDSNPHIRRVNSPLETLIMDALRRYGDFSPAGANAQTILLMLDFANSIIDEVRAHPYWDGSDIDYYTHVSDAREIPDNILRSGLAYYYAMQQGSQKMQTLGQQFIRDLNRELYYRLHGNGPLEMTVVDRE